MSNRCRLPNRRAGENVAFTCRDQKLVAHLGYYPDGSIGEVFLTAGKAGTDLSVSMIETAVAVSMALQHGCSTEALRAAMPRTEDGKAEGAIGQLLDLLAKPRIVT